MHYATIKECDVANGPGVRVSVFVSGCNHHCKGCFNEVAWNFNYGKEFTQETIDQVLKDLDHDYIEGLSLLGGEPLEYQNQKGLLPLVKQVKEKFPQKSQIKAYGVILVSTLKKMSWEKCTIPGKKAKNSFLTLMLL